MEEPEALLCCRFANNAANSGGLCPEKTLCQKRTRVETCPLERSNGRVGWRNSAHRYSQFRGSVEQARGPRSPQGPRSRSLVLFRDDGRRDRRGVEHQRIDGAARSGIRKGLAAARIRGHRKSWQVICDRKCKKPTRTRQACLRTSALLI